MVKVTRGNTGSAGNGYYRGGNGKWYYGNPQDGYLNESEDQRRRDAAAARKDQRSDASRSGAPEQESGGGAAGAFVGGVIGGAIAGAIVRNPRKTLKIVLIIVAVVAVIAVVGAVVGSSVTLSQQAERQAHPDHTITAQSSDYALDYTASTGGTDLGYIQLDGSITNATPYDWKDGTITATVTAKPGASDTQYDGKSLTVRTGALASGATYSFADEKLTNGGGMTSMDDYTVQITSVTYVVTDAEAQAKGLQS